MIGFTLASNGAFAEAEVTKEAFETNGWQAIGKTLDAELAQHAINSKVRLGRLLDYNVRVFHGSNEIDPVFLMMMGMDLDFTSIRVKLAYEYALI